MNKSNRLNLIKRDLIDRKGSFITAVFFSLKCLLQSFTRHFLILDKNIELTLTDAIFLMRFILQRKERNATPQTVQLICSFRSNQF